MTSSVYSGHVYCTNIFTLDVSQKYHYRMQMVTQEFPLINLNLEIDIPPKHICSNFTFAG